MRDKKRKEKETNIRRREDQERRKKKKVVNTLILLQSRSHLDRSKGTLYNVGRKGGGIPPQAASCTEEDLHEVV